MLRACTYQCENYSINFKCPLFVETSIRYSPVGGLSTCVLALSVAPSELPSCHTLKVTGSRVCAYHLLLSPMRVGSKTPVLTLRKAILEGVMDHSARNSTACKYIYLIPLRRKRSDKCLSYSNVYYSICLTLYPSLNTVKNN